MTSNIFGCSRASQSMMAMGVLLAAATSICLIQTRRRRRKQNNDDGSNTNPSTDDEASFYKQLGVSEENLPTHIKREIAKERKRKAKVELISMKTPMYDNVYMLDSNREPMCTISMKKAKWYIKKGIAEWSSFKDHRDGSAIRLENGDAINVDNEEEELEVYPTALRAQRVQALRPEGDDERKPLPAQRKAERLRGVRERRVPHPALHRPLLVPDAPPRAVQDAHVARHRHNVSRLSPPLREAEEGEDDEDGKDIRMKLGAGALDISPVIDDPHLHHIRSCAIALVKWKDKMPAEKVESHSKTVREHLASVCKWEDQREALLNGKEELNKAQLQKACGVNYRVKNPNFVEGAELVVRSLKDAKSTEEFIVGWRKHFVATVNPQHMPTGWRVDNPVVCGSRKGDIDGVRSW
eukprot:CAMPEP_0172533736 /NCGR_PEP_ID=MMETSP1067-20121228/6333_1 /TAXON_ID=265564 ORGANISM="Thalassiosira punctigera, Strain Tpunct2005C2" /NCGR_SAMPLE_ID=MMETSP1067 /ASSEMBLY_ACC=CAM_ASM_000444 /LENGTH=409 /DNA_ID=CAMNT_0013318411 /DNA_START=154 /DNA_END=1383 /DNA_ORIENTATION=+